MRKTLKRLLLPLLAAAMLVFALAHVVWTQQTPPRPPPAIEPPRTPFRKTVAGAGIVEASTENVAVGTALPGLVLEVYVPVVEKSAAGGLDRPGVRWAPGESQELIGKSVHKGDPLFLVDNRALQAQLRHNQTSLALAQAQLARLQAMPRPEEVSPREARVRVAESASQMQEDLAERRRKLVDHQAISKEETRQRGLGAGMAREQLGLARTELALVKAGAWEADLAIARATVEQARALIAQTQTDLDRALVRAPLDGKILQVNVRPGEYVGAPPGRALIVLGDIHKRVHVRVDVDEQDIPRYRPGAPARAASRQPADLLPVGVCAR